MELTDENFNEYAAKHYDNHFCISESEFQEDLRQVIVVRRMMSHYMNSGKINLRLMVNNVIIFYNCFEHHAATKMIQLKIEEEHVSCFNAILKFLSLPMLIPPDEVDEPFYEMMREEFQ